MNYSIKTTKTFDKELKRLSKKYHSIKKDFSDFLDELEKYPETLGVDLGKGQRKIRMRISDKGKGKSGGARVITHTAIISVEEGRITLLTIYDKSEQENISDTELKELLKEVKGEQR